MKAAARRALPVAALLALSACTLRAAIPPPREPLARTRAEAMAPPPSEPMPEEPFRMRLISRTLDNGMQLLVSRGEPNGVVAVVFVSRAVPRFEARAPEAVTAMLAATILRATRDADGTIMDDLLEEQGFGPLVEALPEGLRVTDRIEREELPRYIDSLARSLRYAVFRPEDLRVELAARLELLDGHMREPDGVLEQWLPSLLYAPDDPRFAWRASQLATLRGLTVTQLEERHAQLVDPSRSAIVLVGDVEPLPALAALGVAFSDWPTADGAPEPIAPHYREDGPRGVALVRPLVRSYVKVWEHAPPLGHQDQAAFLVLEQMLGAAFAAHLNLELRERRGISYGVHATYEASAEIGEIELVTAVDPEHTREVVEAIVQELRRVRGEAGDGIEPLELTLARTRAREVLLARLDTVTGLATAIGHRLLAEQEHGEITQLLLRIDALDADDVEAAARRWLRPDRAPIGLVAGDSAVQQVASAGLGVFEIVEVPRATRR